MAGIKSYKELTVWQKSMDLVEVCYEIAEELPKRETYALGNQIIRAAVSIPSNIAEGYRRNGRAEYVQFCGIASGSAAELETQLLIARRIYKIDNTSNALTLIIEVQKMLYALIKRLQTKP